MVPILGHSGEVIGFVLDGQIEVLFSPSSRVRRVSLKQSQKNRVLLVYPISAKLPLEKIVRDELVLIKKMVAKNNPRYSDFVLVLPETSLKVLGWSFRFEWSPVLKIQFDRNQIIVSGPSQTDWESQRVQTFIQKGILSVYHFEAKKKLLPRLVHLASQKGLVLKKARIRNSKSRWGSCSGQNSVTLSSFCLNLPEELQEYVMCHELAHIVEKNHSQKFWNFLEKLLPGAIERDKQLNAYKTQIQFD